MNGLAYMKGVSGQSRLEFAVALVRGLGRNLSESQRETFAKEVSKK